MKLKHAKLLREYHLKCSYQFTYPVAWDERLKQIDNLISSLTQRAPDSSKAGVFSLPESVKVENTLPAESG